MVLLPYPPGQMCSTGGANAITTDGTKIASTYETGGSGWNIAYVYNVTTGATTTLIADGDVTSSVGAMSADGSTVGGEGNVGPGSPPTSGRRSCSASRSGAWASI